MPSQLFFFFLVYSFFVTMSALLNTILPTRIPRSFIDFLKLTFFPYVVYNLIFKPSRLKRD